MSKARVELAMSYRLLNPGSVVLVSVGDGHRDNLFPVTWNMPVRKDPPMMALLSGKGHYSYPLIASTGEFGINIPVASQADAVLGCGSLSGRQEPDKFGRFGLTRLPAARIDAPLVSEAVANLECVVCQVVDLGDSGLFVAQVVNALADDRHFRNGDWQFDQGLQLLHHLGGSRFCTSDQVVTARFS